MPDYSNGKIYKIVFEKNNYIYVGSTTQSLPVRFYGHKRSPTNDTMRELFIKDTARIILIEEFPCKNRSELTKREQYWIDEFKKDKCVKLANKVKSYADRYYCELCDITIFDRQFMHDKQKVHKDNLRATSQSFRNII
jgi:hypothetical protein